MLCFAIKELFLHSPCQAVAGLSSLEASQFACRCQPTILTKLTRYRKKIKLSYRVSLKKRSLTRLAPLEAPRLLIGLEISPKCYQILYIGQTYPFTHFNTIYGWFPPNYGPKYGPFKQNKFHCFRILYSTIFNNVHEKWTK